VGDRRLVGEGEREQGARPPGVLAGDEVGLPEDAQRAQGDVLEVADRSRDYKEGAAQAVCSFASVTKIGRSRLRMTSRVITHSLSPDRKSTRLNSSHVAISYAVFCLKKKK